MKEIEGPNGATFLFDGYKGSYWTFQPAYEVLRAARAPRKIAVLGSTNHTVGDQVAQVRGLAREALAIADLVFMIGPHADPARALQSEAGGEEEESLPPEKDEKEEGEENGESQGEGDRKEDSESGE